MICNGAGRYYESVIEQKIKDNFSRDLNKLNNIITDDYFDLSFNNIELKNDNGKLKIINFSKNPNSDEKTNDGKMILSMSKDIYGNVQ